MVVARKRRKKKKRRERERKIRAAERRREIFSHAKVRDLSDLIGHFKFKKKKLGESQKNALKNTDENPKITFICMSFSNTNVIRQSENLITTKNNFALFFYYSFIFP